MTCKYCGGPDHNPMTCPAYAGERLEEPAFPQVCADVLHIGMVHTGMSLRDWFAGQAITAISSRWKGTIGDIDHSGLVRTAAFAYELADAMLEARNR